MMINLIILLSGLVASVNLCWSRSLLVGIIAGGFFLILSAINWGELIANKMTPGWRLWWGGLFFLCATSIFLTLVYYAYGWNNLVFNSYILLNVIGWWLRKNSVKQKMLQETWAVIKEKIFSIKNIDKKIFWWAGGYLISVGIGIIVLLYSATTEPVRTPWSVIPKYFFGLYALASIGLFMCLRKLNKFWSLVIMSIHFLFSFSVVQIIFPLGYGYDSLIHQAAEKYILTYGFILPKSFYYIGQYALVAFFSQLSAVSYILVDRWLVPIMAAVFLPGTIYYIFNFLNIKETVKKVLPVFILFIPFAIFTFTTPQNLADLLVIILACCLLAYVINQKIQFYWLIILSATIIFIHPLAGLAAGIATVVAGIKKLNIGWWGRGLIAIFLSALAPIMFWIFSLLSPTLPIIWQTGSTWSAWYQNIFRFFPDLFLNTNFVHLLKTVVYFLWQPLVIFLSLLGLAVAGGQKVKKKLSVAIWPIILVVIILIINSWLLFSKINFPFLIDYERGDFSGRIWQLATYFLWPLALLGIAMVINKILIWWPKKKNILISSGILIISLGLTISFYFSYPRHDGYAINRGFNTSKYDFLAVKEIEEKSDKPYAVLTNQQAGAAALTTFGYRYFDHKYFFYSIPTGGSLYQIYAKIAYEEKINYEIVKEAMDLVKVDLVYVYLPDYWFNLKKIMPPLLTVAEETWSVADGRGWVFKFERKQ